MLRSFPDFESTFSFKKLVPKRFHMPHVFVLKHIKEVYCPKVLSFGVKPGGV